jgi:hypothetical protein
MVDGGVRETVVELRRGGMSYLLTSESGKKTYREEGKRMRTDLADTVLLRVRRGSGWSRRR